MARATSRRIAWGVLDRVRDHRLQRPIPCPRGVWHRAQGQEALRACDVRRQWAHMPHVPQQAHGYSYSGRRAADHPQGEPRRPVPDPRRARRRWIGTTRVQAHATIRMTIPLPPWLSLADDPGATHVTVFRGIPSTRNTPALDAVLLYDGRAPTLQEQALDAIHDHYQNGTEPTAAQLDAIAEFQRTDDHFFSSDELEEFAAGGPPPELPPGVTPAEKRGRTFFVDAPFAPPSKEGVCALCHSGPMLNRVSQDHSNFSGQSAARSALLSIRA